MLYSTKVMYFTIITKTIYSNSNYLIRKQKISKIAHKNLFYQKQDIFLHWKYFP